MHRNVLVYSLLFCYIVSEVNNARGSKFRSGCEEDAATEHLTMQPSFLLTN